MHTHTQHTYTHKYIHTHIDVALLVLEKCTEEKFTRDDEDFEMNFNYEFVEDFIEDGARNRASEVFNKLVNWYRKSTCFRRRRHELETEEQDEGRKNVELKNVEIKDVVPHTVRVTSMTEVQMETGQNRLATSPDSKHVPYVYFINALYIIIYIATVYMYMFM